MKVVLSAVACALMALAPIAALAQATPSDLRDLLGARGSSFDGEMESRGYTLIKTMGIAAFWWNGNSNTCVSAAIDNGRISSIQGTSASDCGQSRSRPPGYTTRVKSGPAVATSSEQAICKLTNTAAGRTLFDGDCSVTQRPGYGGATVFEVHMGNGTPFMFAGKRGETIWMHGADKVHFTDLPNGAIFHWGTFALVVAE